MKSEPGLTIAIACIAALAALAGAGIAAWSAAQRQQRQLAHETQRQQRQLTHDRELADLSELRGVLDECVAMLAATFNSYANAVGSAIGLDQLAAAAEILKAQGAPDVVIGEAFEAVLGATRSPEAASAKLMEARALGERISIRVGDETLRGRYDAALHALFSGTRNFVDDTTAPTPEQYAIHEDVAKAFHSARLAFASAARQLVGSQHTSSGVSTAEAGGAFAGVSQ